MKSKVGIKIFTCCYLLIATVLTLKAQEPYEVKQSEVIYKEIDGFKLEMNVYAPIMQKKKNCRPWCFFMVADGTAVT